jgi:hypothetical protein
MKSSRISRAVMAMLEPQPVDSILVVVESAVRKIMRRHSTSIIFHLSIIISELQVNYVNAFYFHVKT